MAARSSATLSTATAVKAADLSTTRVIIDRSAFSSINFSAPSFVNNISNRILFPILLKTRQEQRRRGGTGGSPTATSKIRASDGSTLFSNPNMFASARQKDRGDDDEETDYLDIATQLSIALDQASDEIGKMLQEEEVLLQQQEVRCKRVEIKEKRQLATIRLGLEATSTRLQEYENRVNNAKTATAGIEQHLSQSNARVQRGKSVSQLLRLFKMLTGIQSGELSAILKVLSKARVLQRTAVTEKWESGNFSAFNPRYYTTVTSTADRLGAADSSAAVSVTAAPPSVATATMSARSSISQPDAAASVSLIKTKAVFRSQRASRRGSVLTPAQSTTPQKDGDSPPLAAAMDAGNTASPLDDTVPADEDLSDNDDSDDSCEGEGEQVNVMNIKLHRAEAAAVSAGLDRLFAARSCTEVQVDWCQKLLLLANELGSLAPNTQNVTTYVEWLRQELVSDLFHIIARFNVFYDQNPQPCMQMPYGKALLKTMEVISRLFLTITPSTDALMAVFFSRSVNDLGVALFSDFSPQPLPNQPPLPESSPLLAMDHFKQRMEGDLRKAFAFLLHHVKRDVTVVETIFGSASSAHQQLLTKITDGVTKRFIGQQIKLAETFLKTILDREAQLSPRTKRRCGLRVVDAMAYYHSVEVRLYELFQDYIVELKKNFAGPEAEFLNRFTEVIFVHRAQYSQERTELDLLTRYFTLIEEKHTRSLHPIPDENFDLREAHMRKTKELMDRMTEVTARVKSYALPKEVGRYVFDLIDCALKKIGAHLDEELRKTYDSVRADRDNWRLHPKSEVELLKPSKPESQQCGFRMLLFAQSSLMSLNDSINSICMPLLENYPRMIQDIEDARCRAMEKLDDRAERLLNLCAQAVIVRSLAILLHFQNRSDYQPKETATEADAVAPPCTRAGTLFCYYVTRQFEEAKEFIRLSNGQVALRPTASPMASGSAAATPMMGRLPSGTAYSLMVDSSSYGGAQAVRARAQTMSLQQLIHGDGGPSSFVRTVGVCLFRGIAAHLQGFTASDRGALVYKQDVTAYKEAMAPLTATPGMGGAVVDTLFQMLKETSSLLIMPLDHIKEVKESGTLRLMGNEEKVRYIRIRQDVRDAFKVIGR